MLDSCQSLPASVPGEENVGARAEVDELEVCWETCPSLSPIVGEQAGDVAQATVVLFDWRVPAGAP